MPLVPITPPPGVVKPGTVYDAKGRWYDTLWVRWFEGVMQAIKGFTPLQISGTQVAAGERVSGTWAWKDNSNKYHLAYGGPSSIQILRTGAVFDITPVGFSAGTADSELTTGNYGGGVYGQGVYGSGDELQQELQEGQSYSMDNYGEDLVFVGLSDGRLFYCDVDGDPGADPSTATVVTNAPVQNIGVVVTPENFLMVLGAGNDRRHIRWADQDNIEDWTASATNQAGDLRLAGRGDILNARRSQSETLVWTDTDLYSVRYIGGTFVYAATPVGAVGAISRRAMGVVGSVAYWMAPRGFYIYNGFTEALSSPVADWVFSDLNYAQRAKVWCEIRHEYGEIIWHYPSLTGTSQGSECDKTVVYNYEEGFWYNNVVSRTAGEDQGALPYPVAFDGDGLLWRHEVGTNYEGITPSAVSGPMEIGQGDRVMHIQSIIPDEKTLGEVDIYVLTAFYPTSSETTNGPYTPKNPTDVRLTARQIRLKIAQSTADWRIGTIRADVEAGGER